MTNEIKQAVESKDSKAKNTYIIAIYNTLADINDDLKSIKALNDVLTETVSVASNIWDVMTQINNLSNEQIMQLENLNNQIPASALIKSIASLDDTFSSDLLHLYQKKLVQSNPFHASDFHSNTPSAVHAFSGMPTINDIGMMLATDKSIQLGIESYVNCLPTELVSQKEKESSFANTLNNKMVSGDLTANIQNNFSGLTAHEDEKNQSEAFNNASNNNSNKNSKASIAVTQPSKAVNESVSVNQYVKFLSHVVSADYKKWSSGNNTAKNNHAIDQDDNNYIKNSFKK